ncbi:MAG: hypothetical protein ACJAVI_005993 [Candidatus Azotimanducaceae bacterium]|jgi:hypothetical protein
MAEAHHNEGVSEKIAQKKHADLIGFDKCYAYQTKLVSSV